jgi:hypothetical protein
MLTGRDVEAAKIWDEFLERAKKQGSLEPSSTDRATCPTVGWRHHSVVA